MNVERPFPVEKLQAPIHSQETEVLSLQKKGTLRIASRMDFLKAISSRRDWMLSHKPSSCRDVLKQPSTKGHLLVENWGKKDKTNGLRTVRSSSMYSTVLYYAPPSRDLAKSSDYGRPPEVSPFFSSFPLLSLGADSHWIHERIRIWLLLPNLFKVRPFVLPAVVYAHIHTQVRFTLPVPVPVDGCKQSSNSVKITWMWISLPNLVKVQPFFLPQSCSRSDTHIHTTQILVNRIMETSLGSIKKWIARFEQVQQPLVRKKSKCDPELPHILISPHKTS